MENYLINSRFYKTLIKLKENKTSKKLDNYDFLYETSKKILILIDKSNFVLDKLNNTDVQKSQNIFKENILNFVVIEKILKTQITSLISLILNLNLQTNEIDLDTFKNAINNKYNTILDENINSYNHIILNLKCSVYIQLYKSLDNNNSRKYLFGDLKVEHIYLDKILFDKLLDEDINHLNLIKNYNLNLDSKYNFNEKELIAEFNILKSINSISIKNYKLIFNELYKELKENLKC